MVYLGLLLLMQCCRGIIWYNDDIMETLKMKRCIHPEHVRLFDELFLPLRKVGEVKLAQAIALDFFAYRLHHKFAFCQSLMDTVRYIREDLEYRYVQMAPQRGVNLTLQAAIAEEEGVTNTIRHMRAVYGAGIMRSQCETIDNRMEKKDPFKYAGQFSTMALCMESHRRTAPRIHIIKQYTTV